MDDVLRIWLEPDIAQSFHEARPYERQLPVVLAFLSLTDKYAPKGSDIIAKMIVPSEKLPEIGFGGKAHDCLMYCPMLRRSALSDAAAAAITGRLETIPGMRAVSFAAIDPAEIGRCPLPAGQIGALPRRVFGSRGWRPGQPRTRVLP